MECYQLLLAQNYLNHLCVFRRDLVESLGGLNPVMDGSDFRIPPVLGVFNQLITSTDFSAGHALHYRGSLDGLELLTGNDE